MATELDKQLVESLSRYGTKEETDPYWGIKICSVCHKEGFCLTYSHGSTPDGNGGWNKPRRSPVCLNCKREIDGWFANNVVFTYKDPK